MKNKQLYIKLLVVLLICLITIKMSAQGLNEEGIFQKYYLLSNKKLEEFKELKRLSWSAYNKLVNNNTIRVDGEYLALKKNKKKYDEITFVLGGRWLTMSGKLFINKNKSYGDGLKTPRYTSVAIEPTSDIRYKSNGQLFASIEDIEGTMIKPSGNLYYEDGSVLYSEELDESGQYNRITIRRANGEYDVLLNAMLQKNYGSSFSNMIYPTYPSPYTISPIANETSVINFENGHKYIGCSTLGTYDARGKGAFTGFMPTLFMEYGNGGVFFLEKPWSETPYQWALVVDGEVEMTIPAKATDKPQIDSLLNNLSVKMNYYPNSKLLNKKEENKTIYWPTMDGYLHSKDTTNLNGYGIKFHTTDSIFKGDHSYLEVGTFKDGKLHGMGYKVNITRLYNDKFSSRPSNQDEDYQAFAARVKGAAGVFDNGILVEGRELNIDNARKTYINGNRWRHIPVEGFAYIGQEPLSYKKSVYHGEMPFTEVPTYNSYIYISKIKRQVKVLEINTTKKAIKVMGDYNEPVWLDKNSGPIYYHYSTKTSTTSFCPKTITRKKYKEIDVNKSIDRNTTTVRKVDGAIVDYYYITRKSDPIKYTVKETVYDGYETVTCPVCNGAGIRNIPANSNGNRQLTF
ncbi:hypothetical protein BXQ17_03185 [Polaribacter sp. BM10]|uniref:hypothetical protein n=1 Tax=Polaribacter sp. BM10 TaxID=1529069 RepID=UPI00098A9700|nr:hypothetical protein [Polaribacter sp. BM10]AQS93140.1 hypothetical protein BXQ17_03185 [Polaribacter sp. BM10]